MATPGQMVEMFSKALGMPSASIVGYDRHLADAGIRTKSGRGNSAASVSARDAACLLTAILGGGQVKDAVSTIRRYEQTRVHAATSTDKAFARLHLPALQALPRQASFIDGLECLIVALIEIANVGGSKAWASTIDGIEVAALAPGAVAEIEVKQKNGRAAHVRYAVPTSGRRATQRTQGTWQSRIQINDGSDLEQYRRVSERTLFAIANLLRKEKDDA